MQILLALSKKEVRDIVRFAIERRFEARIEEAANAADGIELMTANPGIDLVVCEFPGIGDQLLRDLGALARRQKSRARIHCVLCSAERPATVGRFRDIDVLGFAPWNDVVDSVLDLLDGYWKTQPDSYSKMAASVRHPQAQPQDSQFCRIRTALLIRVGPLKSDIYIRLSEIKFLKLFNEGDHFDEQDYKRYLLEKRVEYLYVKRSESSEFLAKFRDDLLRMLAEESISAKMSVGTVDAVFETAQELLGKLGATTEVQQVIKANIQLTIRSMARSAMLGSLLSRLAIDPKRYIASHSLILPQIAGLIAVEMDWRSDGTIYKLCMASFLHDIALTNNGLATIRDMTELARRSSQFTEIEVRNFRYHPARACEIARQFQEIPPDVDVIVADHHEYPDGSGFPRGRTHSQLSPLASLFIVAHDMMSAVYNRSSPFILADYLEATQQKFSYGIFKKIHKCLVDAEPDLFDEKDESE